MKLNRGTAAEFSAYFYSAVARIRSFEGCISVELFRDAEDIDTVYTLSEWGSEKALDEYRSSELFLETWRKVKPLFRDKAIAWSMVSVSPGSL
jgi:quinol monooxygenase YgiN